MRQGCQPWRKDVRGDVIEPYKIITVQARESPGRKFLHITNHVTIYKVIVASYLQNAFV